MDEAVLIALVRKAIGLYKTTGCLEYVSKELEARIRRDLSDVGTPSEIKQLLVRHSREAARIDLRLEDREEYQDKREFWFRVLIHIADRSQSLFYELDLLDDDPDVPMVAIVNVHWSS